MILRVWRDFDCLFLLLCTTCLSFRFLVIRLKLRPVGRAGTTQKRCCALAVHVDFFFFKMTVNRYCIYLVFWLHGRGHASVCLASTATPDVPTVTPPPVFLFDVPSYKTTFLIAWGSSAVRCFWEGAVTWDFHLTWLCCYLWKCPEAAASGLPIVTQGQKLDLHFFFPWRHQQSKSCLEP